MADPKTFAQTVFESAKLAAEGEIGRQELKGHSREQFIMAMEKLTTAMDQMPTNTSLHVFLLALSYTRNALILTMKENQKDLEKFTGGTA